MIYAALVLSAPASASVQGQAVRNPTPPGQRITARDGDTIVVDEDARVRLVRRRSAHVRMVFNAKERWLVVLARYAQTNGTPAHTGVDETYIFRELDGDWPSGDRWEGDITIEAYSLAGVPGGPAGYGVQLPSGLVQLFPRNPQQFKDPAAAVLSFRGSSRKGVHGSFDDLERTTVAEAMKSGSGGDAGVTGSVTAGVTGYDPGLAASGAGGAGRPSAARKIHDVRPIWPEAAQRAGVQGLVVVELNIAADGSVAKARILRGIPLLDDAALECVRQWRYEPTVVNGQPVPVIISAGVSFP